MSQELLQTIQKGRQQRPPKIIVYGQEGVGKSTLAAGAPSPIFIPIEDGIGEIDAAKFPLATTYTQVTSYLDTLCREEHEFETVVIDSLDWLERLIWDHMTNGGSIEEYGGGYGKGYTAALKYWREITAYLNRLRDRGMVTICIAHAAMEKVEDPEGPTYHKHSPKLNKHACGLMVEWADMILFAKFRMRTSTEKTGFNKTRTTAAGVGNERVLRCIGGPACVAKNRHGLPDEIPLSWESLVSAMSF